MIVYNSQPVANSNYQNATDNITPMPASWFAEDLNAAETSPQAVFEASLRYVDAGLSVIPIDASTGEKTPDLSRVPT